jgi:hypothetical protein
MDIVLMVFAMSFADVFVETPEQPRAMTAEIVRYNTESKDVHSDMWDPNWIQYK